MNEIPSLSHLSLEQKIGQLLCFGWQGETDAESQTVNSHAKALVEEMTVGSIVLLGRNVGSPDETRALLQELHSLTTIPLLITIDQEGGMVNRLGAPFHQFPGNMALGAVATGLGLHVAEELAERQARQQAREIRAIGLNWNFAPVLDVNNNPDNPIIGVRSYGASQELVARLGGAAIRGYQSAGVMACGKHFPGHGNTAVDSHLALPAIQGNRERLDEIELPPFIAAIATGAGSIMTTHILFPALDVDRPATLSPAIITGLLRGKLGYDGLVITDCLEMNAIANSVGTPRGAVEALKAGADVALICHTLETQRAAVTEIVKAVENGDLPMRRVDESAERVLRAKRRFAAGSRVDDEPWLDPAADALEREIAESSITIVRHSAAIPVRPAAGVRIAIISAHPAARGLDDALAEEGIQADCQVLHSYLGESDLSNAASMAVYAANHGDPLVVLTAPPEPWTETPIDQERQAEMVRMLLQVYGPNLVVVAIRNPYDLRRFPEVANYICTYGYRPCSLRALARVMLGSVPAAGRLPVTLEP